MEKKSKAIGASSTEGCRVPPTECPDLTRGAVKPGKEEEMITDPESHPPHLQDPSLWAAPIGSKMVLTSKSVSDSQFTLKASVRGLELIRGNPGITGDSDADNVTENLCTEVSGGEFSATLLVAGKWIRCSACPTADLKRMQNDMSTKPCAGNKDLVAWSVASTRSSGQHWNPVTPQEWRLLPRAGNRNARSSQSQENNHQQTTMKSASVILEITLLSFFCLSASFLVSPSLCEEPGRGKCDALEDRHPLEDPVWPWHPLSYKGQGVSKNLFSFSMSVFDSEAVENGVCMRTPKSCQLSPHP